MQTSSRHELGLGGISAAEYMRCHCTCRMSRGLKPSLGLLHLSKGLSNSRNGLIKSKCVNKGFAPFLSACRFNFISHVQEVRQLSSFNVTPDRPSVDERFELEVSIMPFSY